MESVSSSESVPIKYSDPGESKIELIWGLLARRAVGGPSSGIKFGVALVVAVDIELLSDLVVEPAVWRSIFVRQGGSRGMECGVAFVETLDPALDAAEANCIGADG